MKKNVVQAQPTLQKLLRRIIPPQNRWVTLR